MKINDKVSVRLNTLNGTKIVDAEICHIKGCRVTITMDNGMSIVTHESNIISIHND